MSHVPTPHFHCTSIHALSLNIIPISVTDRLSSSSPFTPPQPSYTNDFSKSFCQLFFFSICMASSTTHLINLFPSSSTRLSRTQYIFFLLPIQTASFSFHTQFHFLDTVYPPKKRFWRLAAALEQVDQSAYSTHTPLPHSVTPNPPKLLITS